MFVVSLFYSFLRTEDESIKRRGPDAKYSPTDLNQSLVFPSADTSAASFSLSMNRRWKYSLFRCQMTPNFQCRSRTFVRNMLHCFPQWCIGDPARTREKQRAAAAAAAARGLNVHAACAAAAAAQEDGKKMFRRLQEYTSFNMTMTS